MNINIVKGFIISFIIFIVCTGLISWWIAGSPGEAGMGLLPLFLFPPLGALIFSIPFLFLNSISLIFIKNFDFRKGIKWGYLFILIYFIFLLYINISNNNSPGMKAYNKSSEGKAKNDESVCEQIKIPSTLNSEQEYAAAECFEKIAEQKNDILICDKIIGRSAISVMSKINCYTAIARALENPTYCDKISDSMQKSACIEEIAVKTKNLSYCSKIADLTWNKICNDTVQGLLKK